MQQKMASVLPATGTTGTALAEPHRAVKRPRAPRKSVTESMDSAAEQLWSAKTRNFLEFDSIAPTNGLPLGGVGVAAGSKGDAAFYSYLKQPAVIARLQAEGFERANRGAPHPWFMMIKPGAVCVSPAEKALCRSLTSTQRARIEANRLVAIERRTAGGVGDTMA
jgi:hypothetical protein